ncbi:MAG: hypothetical protein KL785_09255 [Brevundimonas sp.]|nr:hypothetical protein [Brevundimonas sp.]
MTITGRDAPDVVGNAVIRVAPGSNAANYELVVEDSRIADLTVNRGFDVVSAGKGSMADAIALRRVVIEDVTGAVVSAAAETDDRGAYNAEQVTHRGLRLPSRRRPRWWTCIAGEQTRAPSGRSWRSPARCSNTLARTTRRPC